MKITIKAFTFFALFCVLTIACKSIDTAVSTNLPTDRVLSVAEKAKLKQLEQLIQERVTENNIPALSVGLIKDNKIFTYQNVGAMTRGGTEKVNEKTVYQIASLSKMFTGIIAKELMAEGKIDANASITTYLPSTLSKTALEKLKPITIRDLLHHKSGFPRDAEYAKRPWKFLDGPMVGGFSEAALLQDLEELALINTPGSRMEYSNLGFGTMGYILERTSGIPLPQLYEKYLGEQYGMQHTTQDLTKAKALGMATPYMKWWRSIKTSAWEMGYLRAGGGLCTTVEDLTTMMLQQMAIYQNDTIDKTTNSLYLSNDKTSWGKSGFPYYGYGMMEFNKPKDTTMIHFGHGGDVDGFASTYIFFPKQEVGIVMLTSSGGEWFRHLEWAIQDVLLDVQPRQTIEVSETTIAALIGTYQFADGKELTITQEGQHIITQSTEGNPYAAFPYAPNRFYYLDYPAELIFDDGQLQHIDPMGNSSFATKTEVTQLSEL